MKLQTNRLNIIPLSISEMELFIQGTDKLEKELNLSPSGSMLEPETHHALAFNYNLATNDPDNSIWYTFWAIIDKASNQMVANACFKNKPSIEGKIEIGYGTNENFRNKGFMTEAVEEISQWALSQEEVNEVIAETDRDNYPSQKVLQKCNFVQFAENETGYLWTKKKLIIRAETEADYAEIYNLIKIAFETAKVKDGDEQDYAANLRKTPKYIRGLSLVAEQDKQLIGHIMFTSLEVSQTSGINPIKALLIAPLSVKLEYRNCSIGSMLVREGFRLAKLAGFTSVFLCGDPEYYKRFGFVKSSTFNITNVNNIPDQYCLAYPLTEEALNNVSGTFDFY